ncbi:MAG TPA: RNA pseudouridine synthase [Hydrogenophaga sp.]|uniref:RNA pseudouridine synthase n=1 Tax=Hydrogenophaga sp. TaxID=1904254 RepID=UPI002C51F7E6|nr:RNA pseudouridine synthase [Hydrogenophaga sp.]HMN94824.1 RNA pseudouridine synthase [Hydrogenophaga sp.]
MNTAAAGEPQRLAKRVAALMGCSRSEAERFITGGWVRVDGQVVEVPETRVSDHQAVTVDAHASPETLAPMPVLWHKPAGLPLPEALHLTDHLVRRWFSPDSRSPSDRSRIRPVRAHFHRLQPLCPLATDESGLMVFTQSTPIARRFLQQGLEVEHEWLIDLAEGLGPGEADWRAGVLRSLQQPTSWQGRHQPPARASWQSDRRIRLVVKGCPPGHLHRLIERATLSVGLVRRQRIGRVALTGLESGQWRYLLPAERF